MQELEIAQQMLDNLTIKRNENKEKIINLEKIEKEIAQMKEGSIALINQITTVSKIRIYDPKNFKRCFIWNYFISRTNGKNK